jgi:hypothetical protein
VYRGSYDTMPVQKVTLHFICVVALVPEGMQQALQQF